MSGGTKIAAPKVVLVTSMSPDKVPVGIVGRGPGCYDNDDVAPETTHVWIVPCVHYGRPQYFEERNPPVDFVHKGSAEDLEGISLVDAVSNRQVYP
jgi:hypothetical protein